MAKNISPTQRILILFIQGYQYLLSPFIGGHCRFYPTCSQYSKVAIIEHGAIIGCWLMLCRLVKCHPLHAGGNDPVPQCIKKR